nr:hypothetical protein KPHV_06590 [Kitasatospora purpeofusca]
MAVGIAARPPPLFSLAAETAPEEPPGLGFGTVRHRSSTPAANRFLTADATAGRERSRPALTLP